jgi:phosphoserine phosphatase
VESWLASRSLNPADICFYSDSYTDLPLLEFSGRAVAVNPDCFLEKQAKKQGWQILRFSETLGL